jgi:Lon protease-like protein
MPLRLHIFEDRYKEMISLCLQARQPFGVVLIREGVEANGPLAKPHLVGCSAQIIQVEPLEEGRMNVTAVGEERFKILTLNYDHAYLAGIVESLPLDTPPDHADHSSRLRPWLERYLEMLTQAGNIEFDSAQLPDDSLSLAYLAAYLLQVPPAQKQDLLAMDEAPAFVDAVSKLCRREVLLLDSIMERVKADEIDYQRALVCEEAKRLTAEDKSACGFLAELHTWAKGK